MFAVCSKRRCRSCPKCILHRVIEKDRRSVVTTSPDVMGGTPVFSGTRVPIATLIDYLAGGESIDDFLEGFPTVMREHVVAFLEETKARLFDSSS